METFEKLFFEHVLFTRNTFKEATSVASIAKCREELKELEAEIQSEHKREGNVVEEIADCILTLWDCASREGFQGYEVMEAIHNKIAKNKARTWVKNADNTYSHVKKPFNPSEIGL